MKEHFFNTAFVYVPIFPPCACAGRMYVVHRRRMPESRWWYVVPYLTPRPASVDRPSCEVYRLGIASTLAFLQQTLLDELQHRLTKNIGMPFQSCVEDLAEFVSIT